MGLWVVRSIFCWATYSKYDQIKAEWLRHWLCLEWRGYTKGRGITCMVKCLWYAHEEGVHLLFCPCCTGAKGLTNSSCVSGITVMEKSVTKWLEKSSESTHVATFGPAHILLMDRRAVCGYRYVFLAIINNSFWTRQTGIRSAKTWFENEDGQINTSLKSRKLITSPAAIPRKPRWHMPLQESQLSHSTTSVCQTAVSRQMPNDQPLLLICCFLLFILPVVLLVAIYCML